MLGSKHPGTGSEVQETRPLAGKVLDPAGKVPDRKGLLRSPVQISLGMLTLGTGIACLVFATAGNPSGPGPQTPAPVALTGLAPNRPGAPAATAVSPAPRASRTGSPARPVKPVGGPSGGRSSATRSASAKPRATKTKSGSQGSGAAQKADPTVNLALRRPVQRTQTIALDGSRNGTDYTPVAPAAYYAFDANAIPDDEVTVAVPGTTTRYLRLTFTASPGWSSAQLSELQVYSG